MLAFKPTRLSVKLLSYERHPSPPYKRHQPSLLPHLDLQDFDPYRRIVPTLTLTSPTLISISRRSKS